MLPISTNVIYLTNLTEYKTTEEPIDDSQLPEIEVGLHDLSSWPDDAITIDSSTPTTNSPPKTTEER